MDEAGQLLGNLYPYLFSRTEPSYRDDEPDHLAPEMYAKLLIYRGDCHPDTVSRLLGLQAGRQEVKGECITNRLGQTREVTRSLWILSSEPYIRSEALRDHLQWLLEQLAPRAEALHQLQAIDGVQMTRRSFVWTKWSAGDAVVEPEQLGLMAQLGLECSFDVYSCNPSEFREDIDVKTRTLESCSDDLKPFWDDILRPLPLSTSLYLAAYRGNGAEVERLLATVDPTGLDKEALHLGFYTAAREGHLPIVVSLLAASAAVDQAPDDGYRALMIASRYGHLAIVKTLLAGGANVNWLSKTRRTALMLAAAAGCLPIVECLIAHGADVHVAGYDGATALLMALQNENPEVVDFLLAQGARWPPEGT